MMIISEFVQDIALGELAGSNLVELQDGFEIKEKNLPSLFQALNQALRYLYTQFEIKESQVVIKLKEGITRYYLDSDYAASNDASQFPSYIMDTAHEPFKDDVLKIINVFDDRGVGLSINDPYSTIGVRIPEYNCIQITDGLISEYLTVVYRALPPRVPLNTNRNSSMRINIPAPFETALQTYVAALIYMNQGGEEYIAMGNALYAKFMTQIEEIKRQNIGIISYSATNIKPILGEWV